MQMLPVGVRLGWVTEQQADPMLAVICLVFRIAPDIIKTLSLRILDSRCHLLSVCFVKNEVIY